MRNLVTSYVYFLVLVALPAYSLAESLLASNYDVVLTVDDSQYRAQSRSQVRDGHVIPIQFQRYKIEMKISSLDDDRFEVIITIFEKIERSWVQLDADPQGFGGSLGTPVEYRWNHDDIRLNIAIIVSELRQ